MKQAENLRWAEFAYREQLLANSENTNILTNPENIFILYPASLHPLSTYESPFRHLEYTLIKMKDIVRELDLKEEVSSFLLTGHDILQIEQHSFPAAGIYSIKGKLLSVPINLDIFDNIRLAAMTLCYICKKQNKACEGLEINTTAIYSTKGTNIDDLKLSEVSLEAYPLIKDHKQWVKELSTVLQSGVCLGIKEPWFRKVYDPLQQAQHHLDRDDVDRAKKFLRSCVDLGWRDAMSRYIDKRSS